MEEKRETGPFVAFVLLERAAWDPERFKADLLADWDIPCGDAAGDTDSLVFQAGSAMVAVSLMAYPVPDGEAEKNAANNYLWPQAVEVTRTHKAHILVAVLDREASPVDTALLETKVAAVCLKQPGALGVYATGTVHPADFYREAADVIREGELPILDWVHFGLYRTEKGTSAYTYGMKTFGKDEMEILDSSAQPSELRDMLFDFAYYVLGSDVTLRDGETIGFTAEQKLPITRSPGVSVDGDSLKIGYRPA